ncbi:MAG: B12-binding domain-containing radical SAM protein [Bacteroidia bacterium]|nr:B12-binding domain-containing radical SAM protein [Bacteroidia bacterium]
MRPYVPLGILYIAAYLDSKGIENTVTDTTFSSFEQFKKTLLQSPPKIIGIYTNLMTKISVLRTIAFIKSQPTLKHCKVVLGGPEIRYNAANYLQHGADLLVIGEGEETFFEICNSFQTTGSIDETIHGTAFIKGEEIIFTPERTLIRDINTLPMPARHKIDLTLYGNAWKKHHGYSMYSLSTMRGCPYTCKWCSRAVYGGTYRRRSAKLVVDEMAYLQQNYQPDQIWFVDDVFTINHKWLREFRDEIVKRGIKIPYEIITRADRMSDEVIGILKETGCFRVWIGAESGSQKIIDAMDRRVDVKMVRENIIKTKKAGIEAGTFIMLGYPGEDRNDIKETIVHLKESNPSFYTITVAYPITGTPLYEEVNGAMQVPGPWENITDRDYDFKRLHSKTYYKYAIDWVNHEVNLSRSKNLKEKLKYKGKSLVAQAKMLLS